MRLPPIFGSIRFWLALCAIVRLGALFLVPIQKELFWNRDMSQSIQERNNSDGAGYFQFLQRRTELHPFTEDEHCYDEMARNIAAGRGFITDTLWVITTPGEPAMYGGCGYPLFVATVYSIFGAGRELPVFFVQIALQVLALWLIFQTTNALAGATAAIIAAAFFTFHPVLIWLSISMLSEAILVPAMAALLWIVIRKFPISWPTSVGTGILLGIMALIRSTTAALVWMTVAWIIWIQRSGFKIAGLLILSFTLVCAPWTIRNYIHWHRFIPFSTKSGVNAWFFNNPGLKVEFGRAAVEGPQPIDIFDPRIQRLPDEAARNERLMAMFKEFVREHPWKFIGLCWMRFWMAILPTRISSTSVTALISAWYAKGIPLIACIAALIDLIAKRTTLAFPKTALFPVCVVLYWQAIQTLAGPGLRYRLPVEPAWAIIVGIAALCVNDMLKQCASKPSSVSASAH